MKITINRLNKQITESNGDILNIDGYIKEYEVHIEEAESTKLMCIEELGELNQAIALLKKNHKTVNLEDRVGELTCSIDVRDSRIKHFNRLINVQNDKRLIVEKQIQEKEDILKVLEKIK